MDKTTRSFAYAGRLPNASANDYLDEEGLCRQKFQYSVNRSFFYVFVDKVGTNCKRETTHWHH